MRNLRKNVLHRLTSVCLACVVLIQTSGIGQPQSAYAARPTVITPASSLPTVEPFQPSVLRGIKIDLNKAVELSFFVEGGIHGVSSQTTAELIRYFLAAVALPDTQMWVNLSPDEPGRVMADDLARTELGKILLSQDYLLKKLSASLTHPETALGATFWERCYQRMEEAGEVGDVDLHLLNRVWITPRKAVVYESSEGAIIAEAELDVLLEEDYLARKNGSKTPAGRSAGEMTGEPGDVSARLMREIILPEIKREVNEGESFAPLRQIFHSVILAVWFKQNLKDHFLKHVYQDKGLLEGIDIKNPEHRERVYNDYMRSFTKGVYDVFREEYDPRSQSFVSRQYFSGGVSWSLQDPSRWMTTRRVTEIPSALSEVGRRIRKSALSTIRLEPLRGKSPAISRRLPGWRNLFRAGVMASVLVTGLTSAVMATESLAPVLTESEISQMEILRGYENDYSQRMNPVHQSVIDMLENIVDPEDVRAVYEHFNNPDGYETGPYHGGNWSRLSESDIFNGNLEALVFAWEKNQGFERWTGDLTSERAAQIQAEYLSQINALHLSSPAGAEPPEVNEPPNETKIHGPVPRADSPLSPPEETPSELGRGDQPERPPSLGKKFPDGNDELRDEIPDREADKDSDKKSVSRNPVPDPIVEDPAGDTRTPDSGAIWKSLTGFSILALLAGGLWVRTRMNRLLSRNGDAPLSSQFHGLRELNRFVKNSGRSAFQTVTEGPFINRDAEFQKTYLKQLPNGIWELRFLARDGLGMRGDGDRLRLAEAMKGLFENEDIYISDQSGTRLQLNPEGISVHTTQVRMQLRGADSEVPLYLFYRTSGEEYFHFKISVEEGGFEDVVQRWKRLLDSERFILTRDEYLSSEEKIQETRKEMLRRLKEEYAGYVAESDENDEFFIEANRLSRLRWTLSEYDKSMEALTQLRELRSLEDLVLEIKNVTENVSFLKRTIRGHSAVMNHDIHKMASLTALKLKEQGLSDTDAYRYFVHLARMHNATRWIMGVKGSMDTLRYFFVSRQDALGRFGYKTARVIAGQEYTLKKLRAMGRGRLSELHEEMVAAKYYEDRILGVIPDEENYPRLEEIEKDFEAYADSKEEPYHNATVGANLSRRYQRFQQLTGGFVAVGGAMIAAMIYHSFTLGAGLAVSAFILRFGVFPWYARYQIASSYQNRAEMIPETGGYHNDLIRLISRRKTLTTEREFLNAFSKRHMSQRQDTFSGTRPFRLESDRFYDVKAVRENDHFEVRILADSFFPDDPEKLERLRRSIRLNSAAGYPEGEDIGIVFRDTDGNLVPSSQEDIQVHSHPSGYRIIFRNLKAEPADIIITWSSSKTADSRVDSDSTQMHIIPVQRDIYRIMASQFDEILVAENLTEDKLKILNRTVLEFLMTERVNFLDHERTAGLYNSLRQRASLLAIRLGEEIDGPEDRQYQKVFLRVADIADTVREMLSAFTKIDVAKGLFVEGGSPFLRSLFGRSIAHRVRSIDGTNFHSEYAVQQIYEAADRMKRTLTRYFQTSQFPPELIMDQHEEAEALVGDLIYTFEEGDRTLRFPERNSIVEGMDSVRRNWNIGTRSGMAGLLGLAMMIQAIPLFNAGFSLMGIPNIYMETLTAWAVSVPWIFQVLPVMYFFVLTWSGPFIGQAYQEHEKVHFQTIFQKLRASGHLNTKDADRLRWQVVNYSQTKWKWTKLLVLHYGMSVIPWASFLFSARLHMKAESFRSPSSPMRQLRRPDSYYQKRGRGPDREQPVNDVIARGVGGRAAKSGAPSSADPAELSGSPGGIDLGLTEESMEIKNSSESHTPGETLDMPQWQDIQGLQFEFIQFQPLVNPSHFILGFISPSKPNPAITSL